MILASTNEIVTLSPANWIAIVGIATVNLTFAATVLWKMSAKWSAFETNIESLTKAIERLAAGPLSKHEEDILDHERRLTIIESERRLEHSTDTHGPHGGPTTRCWEEPPLI